MTNSNVLRHLRIRDNVPLYRLNQDLAFALALAGFVPPSEGEIDNPYISIVRRFIEGGFREHRATSLRPFLEKANLWRGRRQSSGRAQGLMFWLTRNRLSASYRRLTSTRRG